MSITNGYATLSDFKARYNVPTTSGSPTTDETSRDGQIEAVIQRSSRAIDIYCGRQFYTSGSSVKYFTAADSRTVFVDDIYSSGSVSIATDDDGDGTYETDWASTDFRGFPANDYAFTYLATTPNGDYSFPKYAGAVEVTATWGYAQTISGSTSAPDPIQEACMILAYRLWARKGAPFSIAGGGDTGQAVVLPNDTDIKALLEPYRRQLR